MCLCKQIDNKVNKVCCNCRISKKGIRVQSDFDAKEICQFCRTELVDIGSKIEVPKKSDLKGWKKLKNTIATTKYFASMEEIEQELNNVPDEIKKLVDSLRTTKKQS